MLLCRFPGPPELFESSSFCVCMWASEAGEIANCINLRRRCFFSILVAFFDCRLCATYGSEVEICPFYHFCTTLGSSPTQSNATPGGCHPAVIALYTAGVSSLPILSSWNSCSPEPREWSWVYSKTQTRPISAIWVIRCDCWEREVCVLFLFFLELS